MPDSLLDTLFNRTTNRAYRSDKPLVKYPDSRQPTQEDLDWQKHQRITAERGYELPLEAIPNERLGVEPPPSGGPISEDLLKLLMSLYSAENSSKNRFDQPGFERATSDTANSYNGSGRWNKRVSSGKKGR